jgi:hypothetical protein
MYQYDGVTYYRDANQAYYLEISEEQQVEKCSNQVAAVEGVKFKAEIKQRAN